MEKFVLIDGYSMMYRAFYALTTPMSAPDGTPTNAVHSFVMMLMKVIAEEHPDRLAIAFDMHAPTFRAGIYDGYKATRKPMPDELRAQDPVIREIIAAMDIPTLELEGYEADDILGTVSLICEQTNRKAVLVTGDRDSFQLAGSNTTILYTKKGISDTIRVTPEYIRETYGVEPAQLIDVKSLMGDTSDNIPGIAGIGEKTALKLIQTYGDLEGVLDRGVSESKGKLKERLETGKDSARMSRTLAEIVRKVPIEIDFDTWKLGRITNAVPRLRTLGMAAAIRKVEETEKKIQPQIKATTAVLAPEKKRVKPVQADTIEALVSAIQGTDRFISIALDQVLSVSCDGADVVLSMGGDLLSPGISPDEAIDALRPFIRKASLVCVHNIKNFSDISGAAVFDVMLAAYVLNPQRRSFDAEALCEDSGIDGYADCASRAIYELACLQKKELTDRGMEKIFSDLEMPLAYVLRDMEREGVLVDVNTLKALGVQFDEEIARLKEEIYTMFGEQINLNSPKQLGEMLFGKLMLPVKKKTSRGYSTNAEVLEELAEDYPVCAKLLEYRKYTKLRSTYIDSLIELRDEHDRVHTRFDQVATATGRLSSNEPNLQNIPVRTEIGKQIRAAFIAGPGNVLIDADYSQIELRVLAHIANDETMIAAFNADQDIHARTAAEVYGVPLETVTREMRSACKAVNFGIVYGISDFALAKNIGVSRKEAKQFIERYLAKYSGVKRYMEESVAVAKSKGYAETLMGRRRYLPELSNSNFNIRSFGERCAMNSPIQGTAADIIKLAMLKTSEALRASGLRAKLILQVHDELILEVAQEDAEAAAALLKQSMESVIELKVPLKTEVSIGGDWRACK